VTDEELRQLAERLRGAQEHHDDYGTGYSTIWNDAADAIAGLLADKQHLQAEAETRAAVMDSNSRYARRLAAEVDTLQAEVVSLRERLHAAETEIQRLRGVNNDLGLKVLEQEATIVRLKGETP
jgi:chromosome segregation ATPase